MHRKKGLEDDEFEKLSELINTLEWRIDTTQSAFEGGEGQKAEELASQEVPNSNEESVREIETSLPNECIASRNKSCNERTHTHVCIYVHVVLRHCLLLTLETIKEA